MGELEALDVWLLRGFEGLNKLLEKHGTKSIVPHLKELIRVLENNRVGVVDCSTEQYFKNILTGLTLILGSRMVRGPLLADASRVNNITRLKEIVALLESQS